MDRALGLWLIVWIIIRYFGRTYEEQFYQGCINATGSWKEFHNNESISEPFSCVSLCIKERYAFAAVQNGSLNCYCNSSIAYWLNETECNIRCASSSDLCGGTSAQSVYSTAVPFILSASITHYSTPIQVNTTLTFELSVLIRRPVNEVTSLHALQSSNTSLSNIYINWEINDHSLNFSTHSLHGNITIALLNISLQRPGIFRICASARNLVSHIKRCHSLEVLMPVLGLHMVDMKPKMLMEGHQNVSLVSIKSPLYIKAAVNEGSNVTFLVSFGDNTSLALNVSSSTYFPYSVGPTCVTVWHTYSYCGNFSINIAAFNAFSNQSLPSIPVVAQERIQFANVHYVSALPGTLVQLVVDHHGGCELTYDWTFDDGSSSVTSREPKVLHMFNATKCYKITVRIYNSIGSPFETFGYAYIQSKLSNVTISIESPLSSPKSIYSTGTAVRFSTRPKPDSETSNVRYRWFVNDGAYPNGSIETNLETYEKSFRVAGSFLAYVVAKNQVSSVKSNPIAIIIEDPIKELKLIHIAGKIVPDEEIVFRASMTSGTNVMLIWDFGDGTVLTTNKTIVNHVYGREKVYDIEVMVYNNISHQNASLTTVVTREDSCQPPTVQILRWQKIQVINRFEKVYFESEVTLDCNMSGIIIYHWEVFQMSSNKKLNNITLYWNEPTLIILPYTLPYGVHAVKLKVHKEGTPELYSKAVVEIAVKKVDLVANIKGGSMRVVGYESKENVSLDGSSSFDPDYPEEKDKLRFKWDCQLMSDVETSCYDPGFSLSLHKPILTFPVEWLQTGKSAFFVSLTVSKRGHGSKNTWQIIRMVNAEPHLLTVHCPQCGQGLVNPSDPLVLQGSCLTCPWNNKNLTFQWDLFLISDNEVPDPDPKCVSSVAEKTNNNHGITTPATVGQTIKQATKWWTPSRYVTAFPTRRVTGRRPTVNYGSRRPDDQLVKHQGFKVEKGNICNGPIKVNPPVTPTTRCKYVPRTSYGFGGRYQPTPATGIWVCSTTTVASNHFKTYSHGFGSGTVGFTRPAGSVTGPAYTQHTNKGYPTSKPGVTTKVTPTAPSVFPPNNGDSDDLYEAGYVVPTTKQQLKILSVSRMEVNFPDSWSSTGKMDRDFVLVPGRLKAGYTYMLALNVKDKVPTNQEQRRGMANVFFQVNKNPEISGCSIGPQHGYEMETVFGIECKQEVVKDKLSYEVTSKIHGDHEDASMLVYTGSNEHPTFSLPAGKREHGYKVFVRISMFNYKRTKVKVCPLNITVRPSKTTLERISSEEVLINETKEKIQGLIKVGEEQKVKQLVNILTKALNRRVSSRTEHQRHRRETRSEMLGIIQRFRIRDEASAIQTGEAIDVLTSVKNEVSIEGLKIASQMLSEVASQLNQPVTIKGVDYSEKLVHLVTKLSSNLLAASSYLFHSGSNSTQIQNLTQKLLFQALQLVIKTKLNHLMLGEKPVRLIHPTLGVMVSKSLSVSQPRLALQNVTFILPSNMAKLLGMNSKSYASACLGTIMVVYENNPYMWRKIKPLHNTKVSSLDLTSCHGDLKTVKNLSQEIEINIPWVEHKEKEQQPSEETVKWQKLNTHAIKINNEMKNYSLQLRIQPSSKLTYGFRLKVLVSKDEASLQHSQISKSTTGEPVELFLASKYLKNSSRTVWVGVVLEDGAQNRIKKIFKVSPVNYSISSKWIGCFYWDKTRDNWSTRGCRATEKTSQFTVNCRCNHLTSFGAAAFLAPNKLNITAIGNIVSPGHNLVAILLVGCFILLYVVLMVLCVRTDKQDKRKLGVVDLTKVPCRNPYRYKIIVETGHWFGSGTSAVIMIRLHGENAVSDAIELVGNGKQVFGRGSKDAFLIKSPIDLSPLWKVHVWHYNEGDSPSWFLNRVIVKDMTTKEKWYFDSHRWLAVDQEDGRIDAKLLASPGVNETNLQSFHHSCVQYLVDYHLWLSVAGRPPYSRFTRAQRLTCCFSTIMSLLCVSAAWYKTDNSEPMPLQLLGFLDITWYTVVYGIVCSLIVVPVNLLWILLFRYSRPSPRHKKKVHPSPMDDPITDISYLPINTGTPEEDTLSLLDQTIETLLYLKNLGNKIKWQPSLVSERSSLDSFFATNSLNEELTYTSEPTNGGSRVTTKGAPSFNKLEGAVDDQAHCVHRMDHCVHCKEHLCNQAHWLHCKDHSCNQAHCVHCKDHSCSSCSSESFAPSEVKISSRIRFAFLYYIAYIGWIGCGVTILIGAFFTVSYGLSFGREKSIRWLQSLFISLLESIFISQPIMVLTFLLRTLWSCNQAANKTAGANGEDKDEGFQELPSSYTNMAFDRTQDNLKEALEIKRHQRYLKFLKPLQKSVLSDACEKKHLEKTISSYFKELVSSIVLLVLVCLLASGLYCGCAFDIKTTTQKSILRQFDEGNKNNITHGTMEQWWTKNHDNVVELLYWRPADWALRNTTAPQVYFKDSQSVLVGRPLIHQYKTTERQVCLTEPNASKILHSPDGNNSSVHCWSMCVFEQGSWSSIELSMIKSKAMETVRRATRVGWVSVCTQRITSNLVMYSASQDVFSTVKWEVTGQLSGVSKIDIQVNTLRGTLSHTTSDVPKVIFVLVYLFWLYYELSTLIRMKKKYFKSISKYLAMCYLLLSSLSIAVYIYWSLSLYHLFRAMLTEIDHDLYSAGTAVYRSQEVLVALYSMLIFVLILKLIYLLTVFKCVQRFCRLLSATCYHLVALMVFFLLFMLMFAHTGHLMFGHLNANFKTFASTFVYTSGFMRLRGQGHFLDAFHTGESVLSILYLALYIAGVFVVLRGLSVSIFKGSYHSSKRRLLPAHVVMEYLIDWYSRLCKAKNIDDETYESDEDYDEDDDEIYGKQIIPVEYACDEVEFQMEEMMFKLDTLAGTGGLKANKLTYSSDLLSDDEFDDDVEYLYRSGYSIPDHEPYGSGYESDQSFFSFGSANQEGLTDLEKERKISKDSSTVSDSNSSEQLQTFVNSDSPQTKLAEIQRTSWTPKQLYRRHGENSGLHSTGLIVEPRSLQSSSGTSMSSRRPSLTKEFVKPKHLYPLTRKSKIRNGQMLLPEATNECSLPEDSTTSEESEDRTLAKTKSKSSKKYGYRRALGLLPKTSVAPMVTNTDLPVKHYEAFKSEASSLSSPDASYNRKSSSSSDKTKRDNRIPLRRAFVFDAVNKTIDEPTDDIPPPLSPSEPGFGINSQDLFEAQDNLGYRMDVCPPGLINSICLNAEIGTDIVFIDDDREQMSTTQTRNP